MKQSLTTAWCIKLVLDHALLCDWSQLHPRASAVAEWFDYALLQKFVSELAPPTRQTMH